MTDLKGVHGNVILQSTAIPTDPHLSLILVDIGKDYVVWNYNSIDGAAYLGEYFSKPQASMPAEALHDASNFYWGKCIDKGVT